MGTFRRLPCQYSYNVTRSEYLRINCVSNKNWFSINKSIFQISGVKAFFSPNMTDPIPYLDHTGKYKSYSGSDINDLFCYIEIIGVPMNLTYSGHNYHYFDLKTNTDSGYLYPVISALRGRQRIICTCYGWPGNNADSWITRVENLLPTITHRKNNPFNTVHGDSLKNTKGIAVYRVSLILIEVAP